MFSDGTVAEIEHTREVDADRVEASRQKAGRADHLAVTPAQELGDRTLPRQADIQNRKAVGRIEAPAVDASTLARQRIVDGARCRNPMPVNGTGWTDATAAASIGATSRRDAFGQSEDGPDHPSVFARGDEFEGFLPAELGAGCSQPQSCRLIAKDCAEQVDDGFQLEQPFLGRAPGSGPAREPPGDAPGRATDHARNVTGVDDGAVEEPIKDG